MDGLMVSMIKPLWGTGEMLIIDSGFFSLEGLIPIVEKDVLGLTLIKERRYWPKGVPVEEILWHIKKLGLWYGRSLRFNNME